MPRIPFNPSIRPVAASQVRGSKDQSQYGIAVQERATQGLAKATRDVTMAAGETYVNELEKQFNTDMLAGGAMLDELKFKRDEELSRIPVDSSVDYDKVAGEINRKYDNEWDTWSQKNIRNLNHEIVADMRQRSVNAFTTDGVTTTEKNKVAYENARNKSQLDFDAGVQWSRLRKNPSDKDAVESLIRNQYARVKAGEITEGDAKANVEAIKQKTDAAANQNQILIAQNAIMEGDDAAAKAAFSGLRNLTDAEVKKLERETFQSSTYQKHLADSREIDSFEGWDNWKKRTQEDPNMPKGSRQSEYLLNKYEAGILKVNKQILSEANMEASRGNWGAATMLIKDMRISDSQRKVVNFDIESSKNKYEVSTTLASESTSNGTLKIIEGLKDETLDLTISDRASLASDAGKQYNKIITSQSENMADALADLVDDGIWDNQKMQAMAMDDTAEGMGLTEEQATLFIEQGAKAASLRATSDSIEAAVEAVKDTDDYKDLSDTIAMGFIDPASFKFDSFVSTMEGDVTNPLIRAELLEKAYRVNAMHWSMKDKTGGVAGFFGSDVTEAQRDFTYSLNQVMGEAIKTTPELQDGLGEAYGKYMEMIKQETKKDEAKQDWPELLKTIKKDEVIRAALK